MRSNKQKGHRKNEDCGDLEGADEHNTGSASMKDQKALRNSYIDQSGIIACSYLATSATHLLLREFDTPKLNLSGLVQA